MHYNVKLISVVGLTTLLMGCFGTSSDRISGSWNPADPGASSGVVVTPSTANAMVGDYVRPNAVALNLTPEQTTNMDALKFDWSWTGNGAISPTTGCFQANAPGTYTFKAVSHVNNASSGTGTAIITAPLGAGTLVKGPGIGREHIGGAAVSMEVGFLVIGGGERNGLTMVPTTVTSCLLPTNTVTNYDLVGLGLPRGSHSAAQVARVVTPRPIKDGGDLVTYSYLVAGGSDALGKPILMAEKYSVTYDSAYGGTAASPGGAIGMSGGAGQMAHPRNYPIICPVSGGAVVLGGIPNNSDGTAPMTVTEPVVELWNMSLNKFTDVGTITNRAEFSATALPDGRILILGGLNPDDKTAMDSIDIFDPTNGSLTSTGLRLHKARVHPTLTWNGTELIISGGYTPRQLATGPTMDASAAVDVINATQMSIASGADLAIPRFNHCVAADFGLGTSNKYYVLGGVKDSWVTLAGIETLTGGAANDAAFSSRLAIARMQPIAIFMGRNIYVFGEDSMDVSHDPSWNCESGPLQ